MINVLIVDDSAFVRDFLSHILNEDPDINVVTAVPDPYKAVEILNQEKIDVISLDLEMPKMDGLTFLDKIMKQRPLPVVVCSSIAEEGSDNAIKALQLGAVEVITKPKFGLKDFFIEEKNRIQDAIKSAYNSNINALKLSLKKYELSSHFKKSENITHLLSQTTNKVIAIGASTGGTVAIRDILVKIPKTSAGIVISQHMPEGFTKSFSESLNRECQIDVKECEDNGKIMIGQALIARGDFHLKVQRSGAFYKCVLSQDPPVNRHRPSVDVMFQSVAESVGKNALGILLTGMGKDGALGLKAILDAGGTTIIQDEQSCVVYGMPKAAYEIGANMFQLNIDDIAKKIIDFHD